MIVLGIETSCDETGVGLYDTKHGLRDQRTPLKLKCIAIRWRGSRACFARPYTPDTSPHQADPVRYRTQSARPDAIAYTQGPGLAGALLVGASIGSALGFALKIPTLGIHHLEGHLLSPLLSTPSPDFPFVALLVSGGHTQLMEVRGVGSYRLLGETVDDAAGEAPDKTAKLLDWVILVGQRYQNLPRKESQDALRFPARCFIAVISISASAA